MPANSSHWNIAKNEFIAIGETTMYDNTNKLCFWGL